MPTITVPSTKDPKTNLPSAGHERNEELKKRTDQLQQQAETSMPEAYSTPTTAFEPDRELQYAMQEFSMHEVTDKQPGFQYAWVYSGQHGTEITMKKTYGWQAVQGNDPEASELQHVDTTRRLGDCILMRIPQARYDKLMAYQEYVRKMRLGAGDEELQDLGKKLGLNVKLDDPSIIQRFGGNTPAQIALTSEGGPISKMLKTGTVPGLTPGS